METIKLNETDLKLLIKRIVNESYGVPENLTETAEQILNGIIYTLKKEPNKLLLDKVVLMVNGNFNIMDFSFKEMLVIVNIKAISKYDVPTYDDAAMNSVQRISDNFTLRQSEYSTKDNQLVLNFSFPAEYRMTQANLANVFKESFSYYKSILSHEFKHQFDKIKSPIRNLGKTTDYNSYSDNLNKSIPPVNDFIFALYYTHDFENMVRNSELYSKMNDENIKEPEFKTFLENSQVYKNLVRYKYLTIDNIISEIKNKYMNILNGYLSVESVNDISTFNDDQKISELFKILFIAIKERKLDSLKNYLSNPLEPTIELMGKNQEYYKKESNRLGKIDFMKYFYDKQKEINKNADETLKKLSKLYGMYHQVREVSEGYVNYENKMYFTKEQLTRTDDEQPLLRERIVEPTRPNAPRISLEEIRKNMVD